MQSDFGVLLLIFILGLLIGGMTIFAGMTVAAKKRNAKARAVLADMVAKGAVKVNGPVARKFDLGKGGKK